MNRSRHFVLSDAGCYEAGNELPTERRLRTAESRADAVSMFQEQCDYCSAHVAKQLAIISSNPTLTLSSDYYWAVVQLELPDDIDVAGDADDALWTYCTALGMDLDAVEEICVGAAGDETAVQGILESLTG